MAESRSSGAVVGWAVVHLKAREDIGKAIVAAGSELGWSIRLQEPGTARGVIRVRNHEAAVDITYTKKNLQINYASSDNLLHSGNGIHRNYNRWVNNLRMHIQQRVSRIS